MQEVHILCKYYTYYRQQEYYTAPQSIMHCMWNMQHLQSILNLLFQISLLSLVTISPAAQFRNIPRMRHVSPDGLDALCPAWSCSYCILSSMICTLMRQGLTLGDPILGWTVIMYQQRNTLHLIVYKYLRLIQLISQILIDSFTFSLNFYQVLYIQQVNQALYTHDNSNYSINPMVNLLQSTSNIFLLPTSVLQYHPRHIFEHVISYNNFVLTNPCQGSSK